MQKRLPRQELFDKAGLCLQSTWKPGTTNGTGEHTGNDARVVGVTHDLSMSQRSCPDVPPPPPLTHTVPHFHYIPFFPTTSEFHLLSFWIFQCMFLANANYTNTITLHYRSFS